MRFILFLILSGLFLLAGCKKDGALLIDQPVESAYFPPLSGNTWETVSPVVLGWDQAKLTETFSFLEQKNTKAFMILKNGRIVVEKYFGSFTVDSNWYWASAGKTMTGFLVGIAQQEGLLRIEEASQKYLGNGWTSLPAAAEAAITIRHQLTMTTGLDDRVANNDCTRPECLMYREAPGSRWAYHNAPYTLLDQVVEKASGKTYIAYFQEKIRNRIGMNGLWLRVEGFNNVYFSTARSMARFGLLMQAKGQWDGQPILRDSVFFNAMVNSSQNLNPSYGYLTWLNGKSAHMLPTLQFVFNGALTPNAPADMYAALGKNDQKIYVVPSKGLVVIRMGESAGNVQLASSSFDNELWSYLNQVIR